MLTAEAVAERTQYIGGSDAAKVLGLSRWGTPLSVWAEKTGQVVEEKSDKLALEVGNELEDLVCRLFEKRTGKRVHRVNETIVHPEYPFIRGSIDRRVVGEDAILEAKTASAWKVREWEGEEIPREYIIQVMHYLAITGKQRAYIACLIGGNQKFVWKTVERDEAMIAEIISREVSFWREFVATKTMPMQIQAGDSGILYEMFPRESGDAGAVKLGDDADELIAKIAANKESIKKLEEDQAAYENTLKAMLKDSAVGETASARVTWKSQTTVRLDTKALKESEPETFKKYAKASESRVLRITPIKA